ncbi:MAG TPA: FKBP-type peptidyl-prolyl cis-trans isomerase [Stellaceae bacterium]|nr:FKBP-type peptidyl-prolyl cis-trans isomerase [Stellaceae bacterium]
MSLSIAAAAALALFAAAAAPAGAAAPHEVTLPDGLKYVIDKSGTGPAAKPGDKVVVNYTGWLYENGEKGKKFDSSRDRNEPFTFTLGAHQVIPGWDQGLVGMKAGGERTLIIPPDLAYGSEGAGGVIPPNATLMFDVELVRIE